MITLPFHAPHICCLALIALASSCFGGNPKHFDDHLQEHFENLFLCILAGNLVLGYGASD